MVTREARQCRHLFIKEEVVNNYTKCYWLMFYSNVVLTNPYVHNLVETLDFRIKEGGSEVVLEDNSRPFYNGA